MNTLTKDKEYKSVRPGFTLGEIAMVLVIGGILLGGGLYAFNKVYVPTVANDNFGKVSQLIAAVERAKGDNRGAYPVMAAGTSIATSANAISNQMGGTANATDLIGWTYGCASGASSTITLTSPTYTSATIADLVRNKANTAFPQWTTDAPGTAVISLTLPNSVCN